MKWLTMKLSTCADLEHKHTTLQGSLPSSARKSTRIAFIQYQTTHLCEIRVPRPLLSKQQPPSTVSTATLGNQQEMEIEIKRTNKTPGPVPTPYYAPEPRIGPNMAARPTSPVPVDPAAALEGTAACFPASSKMRPFSKSNKKISMEMGKMIGERGKLG